MITAYGNVKQWQNAEKMFAELQHRGFQPDLAVYNAMIRAYSNASITVQS
jgi:pentatricopeptide repeat protein